MTDFIFAHDTKGMLALTAQDEQEARQMLSTVLETCFEPDCRDGWTLCRTEENQDGMLFDGSTTDAKHWWLAFQKAIPRG